jgi:hypothetical protein
MRAHAFTSVPALALLAGLTACSGSSQPTTAADSVPPTAAAATRSSAAAGAVNVPMPDFTGGNLKGALDQLGPDARVKITDASGQHRRIEEESSWKICTAVTDPDQYIVLGVVLRNEHC